MSQYIVSHRIRFPPQSATGLNKLVEVRLSTRGEKPARNSWRLAFFKVESSLPFASSKQSFPFLSTSANEINEQFPVPVCCGGESLFPSNLLFLHYSCEYIQSVQISEFKESCGTRLVISWPVCSLVFQFCQSQVSLNLKQKIITLFLN